LATFSLLIPKYSLSFAKSLNQQVFIDAKLLSFSIHYVGNKTLSVFICIWFILKQINGERPVLEKEYKNNESGALHIFRDAFW